MIELGGARTERRKWIHFFEEMTAVIFCVAMSDYDQLLSEDSSQNRMTETLTLFDSIVNSRWFTKSVIILFLNKIDLFRKKIPLSPLNNYFPDCPGGDDVNEAAQYLLSRFVAVNNETHRLYAQYVHITPTGHDWLTDCIYQATLVQQTPRISDLFSSLCRIPSSHALLEHVCFSNLGKTLRRWIFAMFSADGSRFRRSTSHQTQ